MNVVQFSNVDMRRILDKANFKLLVLVGDIYQQNQSILAITFLLINLFLNIISFELTNPFRTSNHELLTLWGTGS